MQEAKEVLEAAPGVEGKLVEMLDALQNGVVTVGEQVVKYGPDVADTALWVVRIDGIGSLLPAMLLTPILLWGSVKAAKKSIWHAQGLRKYLSTPTPKDREFQHFQGCEFRVILLGGVSLVAGGIAVHQIFKLLDVWNWVAVIEPKLWLAKQIIATVLK